MGCGYEMACWDCGVRQDVGYGSHCTWLDAASLEEFDLLAAEEPEYATREKNVSIRDFLLRHHGHRCEAISEYLPDSAAVNAEAAAKLKAFEALTEVERPDLPPAPERGG